MFSILLSIITFTLVSTSEVECTYEGDVPEGAYDYGHTATTGSKGQMTTGNSTTLVIEGWKGYTIKSVSLSMKSNKSAGTGKLEMTIDGQSVWTISDSKFSSKNWHGAFSQTFVPIEHTFSPEIVCTQGDISIYIEASENSLYVASYTIEYEVPAPQTHTLSCRVTDEMVLPITESSVGVGVTLPTAPDIDGWYFAGWVTDIYTPTTTAPFIIYDAGDPYLLTDDEVLYALYRDKPITPPAEKNYKVFQVTTFESGEYTLCTRPTNGTSYMASGTPVNYRWPADKTTKVTFDDETNLYVLDNKSNPTYDFTFNTTDSTVVIQGISYGSKYDIIKTSRTPWNYRILDDNTILLYVKAGKVGDTYPFICRYSASAGDGFRTEKRTFEQMKTVGFLLFPVVEIPVEEPVVITYKTFATTTTDPTPTPTPVEEVQEDENVEEVYYNLMGQRVGKEDLTTGIYIRRRGKHVEKIYYYE